MKTWLACGFSVTALIVSFAQQPVRDGSTPPVAGTALVSGVVSTDAADKTPGRRARVTLNSADGGTVGRTATTDDAGRFAFPNLPAGRYAIQVTKPGYLTANYGATRPERLGTPVAVVDGQQVTNLALTMVRGGVITGRVVDQGGQPTPGVNVSALRYSFASLTGDRELRSQASGTTDDRGIYRLYGLPPGEYVVMASLVASGGAGRGAPGLEDIRQLTPAEIQRAMALVGDRARALTAGGSTNQPRSQPEGRRVNYAPVFHPSTTDVTSANPVAVRVAEERDGLDIQIQLVPTARIDGSVQLPAGIPPDAVVVTLDYPADMRGALNPPVPSDRTDKAGRFEFMGVAPGKYTLTARTIPDAVQALPVSAEAKTLWALENVVVNGYDVKASLTLEPAMTVAGRVVFSGASPPPKDLAGMSYRLVPPNYGGNIGAGPSGGELDSQGRFRFTGVIPGRYRLVELVSQRGLRSGWWRQSAMADGRDVFDTGLEVVAGKNVELVITYTDRPAELAGTLQDAGGRSAPDYFIIVFPTDRAFWTPASRRVTAVRPGIDGTFAEMNLPPGEYFVAALTDVVSGEWNDAAFLDQLVGAAIRVRLAEGQRTVQDIRIK